MVGTTLPVSDWTEPDRATSFPVYITYTQLCSCTNFKLSWKEWKMEIIKEYFDKGYSYKVILDMLSAQYDINIGTLKARFKESGLRRRATAPNKRSQKGHQQNYVADIKTETWTSL